MPELDGDVRVKAAGGVIVHDRRVCLIHRPKYEDWSGEGGEAAALREVWEETGLTARCGEELTPHFYVDRKGRPKVVRWWRMSVDEVAPFVVNVEVDERRWATAAEAERLLDYEHDRALARAVLRSA